MRAGVLVCAILAYPPAAADAGALRIGLSCNGVLPEAIVIQSAGPLMLSIRIGDLFDACVEALEDGKRWRARS
jgi:hypothetical protein